MRDLEKKACEPKLEEFKKLQFSGLTKDELQQSIKCENSSFKGARRVLLKLFKREELLSHSVSGKAPNSTTPAKPKLNEDKMIVYKDLMRERYPNITDKEMVEKVHHVQKGIKKSIN